MKPIASPPTAQAPAAFPAGASLLVVSRNDLVALLDEVIDRHEPPPVRPALLTAAELADELRVSSRTIARLVDQGLPFVQVAESKRFRLDACLDWLGQRKAGQP